MTTPSIQELTEIGKWSDLAIYYLHAPTNTVWTYQRGLGLSNEGNYQDFTRTFATRRRGNLYENK